MNLKEKLFFFISLVLIIGIPIIGGIYVLEYIKEQKYNVAYFGIYMSILYLLLYIWFPFMRYFEYNSFDNAKTFKEKFKRVFHFSLEDSLLFAIPSIILILMIGYTTETTGLLQSCGYIELKRVSLLNILFPHELLNIDTSNINLENCSNPATESIFYIIMVYCVPFVPFISGFLISLVGNKWLYKES